MNKHIHKLIEALFTDDDDEMLNSEENIIADVYWKDSRRNVIRPKNDL